jgi:uncharacterized protein YrrD
MFINANIVKDYELESLDGEIGKVKEFYFDDKHWAIRYLVADTGRWLTGRKVLISPQALTAVNSHDQHVAVKLTRKQIEDSPRLDSDEPVSKQYEQDYYGYYGWPLYWTGPYMWGYSPFLLRNHQKPIERGEGEKPWDPHLRSTNDVEGHGILTGDGELGHVEDFIIDDSTWVIRYLVVDTKNWWPGKKVLISPHWVESISWAESNVRVNLSRETIKLAPEYVDGTDLTREYETRLHDYYDKKGYWIDEPVPKVLAF